MKRTVVFIIVLVLTGTLAYFGGYYLYTSTNPESEIIEPISVQRSAGSSDGEGDVSSQEYYMAKMEESMLIIYKMPEKTLYDSVELDSLQFHGEEEMLHEGIIFKNLTEVFEFLENSMS